MAASDRACFIGDTVDSLDLKAFHDRYAKDGPRNQPFHPAMRVKVLLYGYATGVFSSHKIAAKLHEDVAFRLLGAGNYPAHRTMGDFRAFRLKELQANLGHSPEQVLADTGYRSETMFEQLANGPTELHQVDAEWKLVCTALNLRRMCSLRAA